MKYGFDDVRNVLERASAPGNRRPRRCWVLWHADCSRNSKYISTAHVICIGGVWAPHRRPP